MKATIYNNPKHNWTKYKISDRSMSFIGGFWWQDSYYSGKKACEKLDVLFKPYWESSKQNLLDSINDKIVKLTGNYAFILDSPEFTVAIVDKIRSYPIFYTKNSAGICIGNSAAELQSKNHLMEIDTSSTLELQMSGFVTGSNTIYKGLHQLQGGEFLFYNKGKDKLEFKKYFDYFPKEIFELSDEELIVKHNDVMNLTFLKLIKSLAGAPVWIPLSGGLDSRLILAKLIEFGYENINTFTYGIPNLWEVKYARKIAKVANVKWQFINYNPQEVRKIYHTSEREEYYRFGSGLCSVPFVNEFYALKHFIKNNIIPENAIIINGQSGDFLTGGHIPLGLEQTEASTICFESLSDFIVEKHFSLWSNLKSSENLKIIKKKIKKGILAHYAENITLDTAVHAYEFHECQERQCKYVVNGQRLYDWFGFDWRLPLWSDELIEFWLCVPWRIKFAQRLYKRYLTEYNPEGLFNQDIRTKRNYCPPFLKIPSLIYSVVSKVLNLDREFFNRTFIPYYGAYSPYYPQKSYLEFLKDSKYHRNTVSYHSSILLKGLRKKGIE